MKSTLLLHLKMSHEGNVDGFIKLCKSEMFPDYWFLLKVDTYRELLGEDASSLEEGVTHKDRLLRKVELNTIKEFEEFLFDDFKDKSDAILRLAIVKGAGETTTWVDVKEPLVEEDSQYFSITSSGSANSTITLAEFDASVAFLRSLNDKDLDARRNVVMSSLIALKDLSAEEDSVLNILFDNVIVALQMSKNVDPVSARKYMTNLMQNYLKISEGGKNQ